MGLIKMLKKGSGMELIDDPTQNLTSSNSSKKMDISAARVITSNFKEEDKFLMSVEQELQRSIEKLQKAAELIRVRRGFNSK